MTLPLSKVFKLRITRTQKAALVGLFTLGFIYTGVEIFRLVYFSATPDDKLAPGRSTLLVNPIQSCIAVVVGCAPILRPLFFKKRFVSSSSETPQGRSRSLGQSSGSGGIGQTDSTDNSTTEGSNYSITVSGGRNGTQTEEHEMAILKRIMGYQARLSRWILSR